MIENTESVFNVGYLCEFMDRIGLIDGYDESKSRETLNLLLRDRQNEFHELAKSLGIPNTTED
ncbi:MAG: hypothetical protein OEL84_01300 [Nitrosopumilus sp.]|nr:hypothetical protein [Nitrosopumilus sp.]